MAKNVPTTSSDSNRLAPAGCTLSDPGFTERLEWIQREILPHALSHQRIHQGHMIRLRDSPELAAALDKLIELESACCSGLEITHHVDAVDSIETPERILTLRGGPSAQIDRALVAALQAAPRQDEPEPGRLVRILRSAGIGTAVAAALCCGLPALIAAVLGAQAAVSFAGWDTPLALFLVAVSIGCFVFFGGFRAGYQALRKPFSGGCADC